MRNARNLFRGYGGGRGEAPLAVYNYAHAEAKTLVVGYERYFIRLVTAAFGGKAIARELVSITPNTNIGVAGTLLPRLCQRYGPKLYQLRIGLGGSGGRGSKKFVRDQ